MSDSLWRCWSAVVHFGKTRRVVVADWLLLPLLVCNAPAARVLMKVPQAIPFHSARLTTHRLLADALEIAVEGEVAIHVPTTSTVTLQEPRAGIAPPIKMTCELPGSAVTKPAQVVLALPDTTTPAGK